MMRSFCAASNLRVFLQTLRCPDILEGCETIMAECFEQEARGTLASDIKSLANQTTSDGATTSRSPGRPTELDDDIFRALHSLKGVMSGKVPGWSPRKKVVTYSRIIIGGLQYSARAAAERDSIVFFQPMDLVAWVPGVIRQIFETGVNDDGGQPTCFLAIHRYLPHPARTENGSSNPFDEFKDFGANICSVKLADNVEVIPVTQKICHGIRRPWEAGLYVMKPLNRVRHCIVFAYRN